MNDSVPPPLPPQQSFRPVFPPPEPLGATPEEREPITSPVGAIEAILRQPRRMMFQLKQPRSGPLVLGMLFVAVLCSLVYGLVVGSFSGGDQLWASPVKVAGGLLISAVICLPSLYIFACLSGSQARLAEICGQVAGLLLLMTLLLIGFAPVAWLFSQSTESVAMMGGLHLVFWFIATCFGLRFLSHAFSESQARTKAGLYTWTVVFLLVAVQMTTALRPLVGTAKTFLPDPKEKKFFLAHWADCLKAPPPSTTTSAESNTR
jgi:hypothetical protein